MKIIFILAFLCAIALQTYADGENVEPVISPAERLLAMQRDYAESETAYQNATRSLPATPEGDSRGQELSKQLDKKQADLFTAAVALAKANPKSQVGFNALAWTLKTIRALYLPAGAPALELMTQQYADNLNIGNVVALLSYYPPPEGGPSYGPMVDLLNAVVQKNPDRVARAQAALGLAWKAKREFQRAESKADADADRLATNAIQIFQTVLNNYGDCPDLRTEGIRPATSTIAGEVEPELYELQHLRTGQLAPEIEGTDLDGSAFKLSDDRGKVVLLVFWASWCGPCMSAVPHEKELVEHFTGRPFVLIGINGDTLKQNAVKAVEKNQIPWRSFWTGEKGPGGPIAVAWNVREWPTMYVLDAKGVIRLKGGKCWQQTSLEDLVFAAEKH